LTGTFAPLEAISPRFCARVVLVGQPAIGFGFDFESAILHKAVSGRRRIEASGTSAR
jgi:hypothetical protein